MCSMAGINAVTRSSANPRSNQAPGASRSCLVSSEAPSNRLRVCPCMCGHLISIVQYTRAHGPGHGRRFYTERRVMVGIEAAQLATKPRDKALIAGQSHGIAATGVILERLLRDHDADHSRALAGAESVARQPPRGEDHHVLRSAGH